MIKPWTRKAGLKFNEIHELLPFVSWCECGICVGLSLLWFICLGNSCLVYTWAILLTTDKGRYSKKVCPLAPPTLHVDCQGWFVLTIPLGTIVGGHEDWMASWVMCKVDTTYQAFTIMFCCTVPFNLLMQDHLSASLKTIEKWVKNWPEDKIWVWMWWNFVKKCLSWKFGDFFCLKTEDLWQKIIGCQFRDPNFSEICHKENHKPSLSVWCCSIVNSGLANLISCQLFL
jgi:hypothetical protein